MQAISLKRRWRSPLCITCHGTLGADESQAEICPELTLPLRHFKAESGEGGGLDSCYVTCLRHGHTAWLLGSVSRRNLCLPSIPGSCSDDSSYTGVFA